MSHRIRRAARTVIGVVTVLLVPLAFSAFPSASADGGTPTSTSLAVDGGASYGDPITLTATVTSDSGKPSGTVTFRVDGGGVIASGVAVDPAGHAAVTTTATVTGLTAYHADFTGSGGFAASSGTALHETSLAGIVLKPIPSVLTISKSVPFRFTMVLSGIATRTDGTPINGERVVFSVLGRQPDLFDFGGSQIVCTNETNAQGYASCEGVQGRTAAIVAILGGGFYMTHFVGSHYGFSSARGKLIVVGGP